MSPAAVDVRSPISSQENPSSAAESRPSSGFDFGKVFPGFGGGAGGEFRRSESAAPGKPRPRLVKVRKQVGLQNPRSRSGAGGDGSGFNPFGGGGGGGNGGGGGFVFGADRIGVTREGSGVGSVKVENSGFVFAARENDPKPDLGVEKEESFVDATEFELGKPKCGEFTKSLSSEDRKTETGAEAEVFVFGANDPSGSFSNLKSSNFFSETDVRKSSCSDFVFGFSLFNSGSNSEKSESCENIETGFQRVEASVAFTTNRSSKSDKDATPFEFMKSSTATAKAFDDVKLNGENVGNLSNVTEVNNLEPEIGLRFSNPCKNSDDNTSASTGLTFKLPDEMRKLNIDDTESTGVSHTKFSHNSGDVSKSTGHSGCNKVSNCFNTNKETKSCDQSSDGHSFEAEKVDGKTYVSKAFAFQAGLCETTKVEQTDNTEPSTTSFSSNYPGESVYSVEEKSHTENSPITPDRFGASSLNSGTPLCDPSSLRESLFPKLNKKLDVKNKSIRDRRSRDSRRKLTRPFAKQCHDEDNASKENSHQEDTNTSGCYSPMDFSPYQESTVTDQYPKETPATSSQSNTVFSNGAHVTPVDFSVNLSSDVNNQETGTQFLFTSGLDEKTKSCMFSAASAGKGGASARRHRYRRKSRIGVGNETFIITPSSNGTFVITPSTNVMPKSQPISQNAGGKSEAGSNFKQGQNASAEVHETCEKWRIRGNEAYKNGELSKAEALYTQGIVSVPSNERSGNSLEPLLLCYSNRAAARMRLQRVREAIGDCMMAVALDPNFLKAQMRAANCHLLLGEIEHALLYFSKCTEVRTALCLDRRIIVDAVAGQEKVQKVAECIDQSAKLLEEKSPDAALRSLEIISEALSISSYSEKLLKLKAEALITLRRHEEAIRLCEQSVSFAEKNFASDSASGNHSFVMLWRWFLTAKSYFLLGKFEAALSLLDKLIQLGSSDDEPVRKDMDSATSLATTIRGLLHTKNAGNEAFKSGRYSEAIDHYTVALSSNVESRHFAAICFCNRAAAHQALGQIADAIADCSLAIALDGNYTKAVSRRATLHEMIRDYGQAASDLQRLISILESQPCDKSKQSGSSGRSAGGAKELRQAQTRLPAMEQEAKNGVSLDFYLILGNKPNDTSADIKKAYRKAALRHHPDKAGQFLARSDSGDEGRVWKEISEEVHKDADRLFKMIGEAYTILSDPSKRSEYDLDEELRKSSKVKSGSTTQRRQSDCQHSSRSRRSDFQSSPFESSYKQSFRDNWKTYGNSYSRW